MSRKSTLVRTLFIWCVGFFAPIALLCLTSKLCNVYPFGTISFLTEDLLFQYVDFFAWFQRVLAGDGSIFYSASQALGTNTWGLYSYYLASPFNLLIVFFDQEHLTDFAFLITALKLGCIQVATMFFLRKRFDLPLGLSLVLALCFTCSSWVASQLRNPLWLDALILLPLLAYTAHCFITEGRWKVFTALLVAAIITCWYTAYILILFLALYLFFEFYLAYCKEPLRFNKRCLGRRVIKFICILVLALLLSAWTFIPTILSMMGDTSSTVIGVEQPSLISTITSHLPLVLALGILGIAFLACFVALIRTKRLQATTKLVIGFAAVVLIVACIVIFRARLHPALLYIDLSSIISGLVLGTWSLTTPQLFGSSLLVILVVACLFYKAIDLRIRIAALLFLGVLVISTFVSPLYYVWCGMRWPNGFYCRMSFLAIFVMLWISALFIKRFAELKSGISSPASNERSSLLEAPYVAIGIASVLFALFTFAVGKAGIGAMPDLLPIASLLPLLIGASVILYLRVRAQHATILKTGLCVLLIGVLVFAETTCSFFGIWRYLYNSYPQDNEIAYVQSSKQQWNTLETEDPDTYRFTKTYRRAIAVFNEGMSQGFNELSSYSSAHNGNAIKFLNQLGYSHEGEFSVAYQQPLLSTDSLLGVKYIASMNQPAGCEPTDIQHVYYNPLALPLGYGLSSPAAEDTLSLTFQDTTDPFERQNKLFSALLGREIEIYKPSTYSVSNQTIDEANDLQEETYAVVTPNDALVYGYVATHSSVPCTITIDDHRSTATTERDSSSSASTTTFLENERFNQNIFCLNPSVSLSYETHSALTVSAANDPTALSRSSTDLATGTTTYAVTLKKDPTCVDLSHQELLRSPEKHEMSCVFYTLDWENLNTAIKELKRKPLTITSFQDGSLAATYDSNTAGHLLLSVPYDEGWTILLDGEPIQASPVLDGALTLIPVSEGEHTLEMHYLSPGFIPGCIISGLTILALIGYCIWINRQKSRATRS